MSKLIQFWEQASKDLNIEIVVSFKLSLPSGKEIQAELLVPKFGSEKGMLIIKDFNIIAPVKDEVIEEGYGFSTLREPSDTAKYSKENYINLLKDWRWRGNSNEKPAWYE